MSNEDLIRDRLDELHVMFPSYGERSVKDLDVLARVFARETRGWMEEKTNLVFDVLLRGKKFPVLDDVLAAGVENKTEQEIDEHKYRSLKFKEGSPNWFLSGGEQLFIAEYERDNPQIANQRPKYPGMIEDDQPRIERVGSGFVRRDM